MNNYWLLLNYQLMASEEMQSLRAAMHVQHMVAIMQLTEQWREEARTVGLAQITLAMREMERQAIEEAIIKHAAEKAYISASATGYMPKRPSLKLVPPPDLGEIG